MSNAFESLDVGSGVNGIEKPAVEDPTNRGGCSVGSGVGVSRPVELLNSFFL